MDSLPLRDSDAMLEAAAFAWRLRELYKLVPFSVTSWWRTPERNAEVGGVPRSLHREGLAVDCVPGVGVSKEAFYAYLHKVGLYGVIEGDHVHLQSRPARK